MKIMKTTSSIVLLITLLLLIPFYFIIPSAAISPIEITTEATTQDVSPMVLAVPEFLMNVDEFDFCVDDMNITHLVYTTHTFTQSYLYYAQYSATFQSLSNEEVSHFSNRMYHPQIVLSDSNQPHVLVGVEDLGYWYYFYNQTYWLNTQALPGVSVSSSVQMRIDEYDQPHFVWANFTNQWKLYYQYPVYSFGNIAVNHTIYYNQTMNSTSTNFSTTFSYEYKTNSTSFSPDISLLDFAFEYKDQNNSVFSVQTRFPDPSNATLSRSRIQVLPYSQIYRDNFLNSSELVISNLTSPENYTTDVFEWTNTTRFYTNHTFGAFGIPVIIYTSEVDEEVFASHMVIDPLDRYHFAWISLNASNNQTFLHYNRLTDDFDPLIQANYSHSRFAFQPGAFQLALNQQTWNPEFVTSVQSSLNRTYLALIQIKDAQWNFEPMVETINPYAGSTLQLSGYSSQLDLMIYAAYDVQTFNYRIYVLFRQGEHFTPTCLLQYSLAFKSASFPPHLNETVNPEYSALIVKEKRDLALNVLVTNYFNGTQALPLVLTLQSGSSVSIRRQSPLSSTTAPFSSLTNESREFQWVIQFSQSEGHEASWIGFQLSDETAIFAYIRVRVIVIPSVDVLPLIFYILGAIAFTSLFMYYKKIH